MPTDDRPPATEARNRKAGPLVDSRTRKKVLQEYLPVLPDRVETPILKAYIGVAEVCNLSCPFCATGNRSLRMTSRFMTKAQFDAILEKLGPSMRLLAMYHWGESLLNPGVYEMIAEASRRSIVTVLHANLSHSWFNRETAARLVRSGLGHIIVSCDGASQRTYQQYRVGGRFDWVMLNVWLLQQARMELQSMAPDVIWKFLVHKGNQHEIETAVRIARRLGIKIRFELLEIPEHGWRDWSPSGDLAGFHRRIERQARTQKGVSIDLKEKLHCFSAWQMPSIAPDGNVLPCGVLNTYEFSLGNIYREKFSDLWNKPLAVAMRRYLRTGKRTAAKLPCYACEFNPHA